jgi:hypothetical protein
MDVEVSLTLREESALRVSENTVVRNNWTYDSEMMGGWRRLNNEEIHNLYISHNIIRVIKSRKILWAGHVAIMEEMRKA